MVLVEEGKGREGIVVCVEGRRRRGEGTHIRLACWGWMLNGDDDDDFGDGLCPLLPARPRDNRPLCVCEAMRIWF
jgi:hypothetical protein